MIANENPLQIAHPYCKTDSNQPKFNSYSTIIVQQITYIDTIYKKKCNLDGVGELIPKTYVVYVLVVHQIFFE